MKKDISTMADIREAVDAFYGRVRKDSLIGPIFEDKLQGQWPRHLDIMYRFWGTVLLDGEHSYTGQPFLPHAGLPLERAHFDRWLALWEETLRAAFAGPVADDAILRSKKMAMVFMAKLEDIRQHGGRPLF